MRDHPDMWMGERCGTKPRENEKRKKQPDRHESPSSSTASPSATKGQKRGDSGFRRVQGDFAAREMKTFPGPAAMVGRRGDLAAASSLRAGFAPAGSTIRRFCRLSPPENPSGPTLKIVPPPGRPFHNHRPEPISWRKSPTCGDGPPRRARRSRQPSSPRSRIPGWTPRRSCRCGRRLRW